jgi:hypothetical protein
LGVASYGYVMEQGKVVLDGTAEALANNEDVKEFYLGGTARSARSSQGAEEPIKRQEAVAVTGLLRRAGDPQRGCAGGRAGSRALARQVAHARAHAPYYAELAECPDLGALARLPLTRKAALIAEQAAPPALRRGGRRALRYPRARFPLARPADRAGRAGPDYWRFARALFATGLRPGDLLHNCFAYHFTPAGSMLEAAPGRSAARSFPPAPAIPNSRRARRRNCARAATAARRIS